jgi:hypothetical protein
MKRFAHRALASAATLVALLCWTSATASAESARPPTHEPFSLVESGVIECDGFQDNCVDFYTGEETTFYDENGEPARLVIHAEHTSNDVNSVSGFTSTSTDI